MFNSKTVATQELIKEVNSKSKGKYGWPRGIRFAIDGDSVTISADDKILQKKGLRRLDPWGLAFLIEAESRCGIKISAINFVMSGKIDEIKQENRLAPDIEAFRRRVSFLSINNPVLRFVITINGEPLELYDAGMLFNRPENEEIHGIPDKEPQDNKPGRLEKDFQTWLKANNVKDEDKDAISNVRLAVLGEDFFKLNKKGFGMLREFPTGAFDTNISEKPTQKSRVLPTERVDIITLNKNGRLAVIELKLNDAKLEVISQIMDYALFFRCYIKELTPIVKEKLQKTPRYQDIVCYVANNHFHDRFDNVMKYYSPKNASYGFSVKKVVLGYYPKID